MKREKRLAIVDEVDTSNLLKELAQLLLRMEWADGGYCFTCGVCEGAKHKDCRWLKAMVRVGVR